MVSGFNISSTSKINFGGLLSANNRVKEINDSLSAVQGNKEAEVAQFSDLLPNALPKEPVRFLNPKVMIELIQSNARKYGVDPKLINAVIKNESGYNLNAKSPAGAIGLMQLMPETARELGVSDPGDPAQNVEAGTKYLGQLLGKFNGNVVLALAAYNAGPGAVSNYGGVPPYKETNKYIMNVLDTYLPNNSTT